MSKAKIDVNRPLGMVDGEVYLVDYFFVHGDDFYGATGTVVSPISQAQYDEQTSDERVEDYLEDIWRQAVSESNYRGSLADYVSEYLENNDPEDTVFEVYQGDHGAITSAFPALRRAVTFDVNGGGRCLSRGVTYDQVADPVLLDLVTRIETAGQTPEQVEAISAELRAHLAAL